MSEAIMKKDVQGIYLTYMLRYGEYAVKAYLEEDLEGLYAVAKMLAAMLPSTDFNHKEFYDKLENVMGSVEDELDTDEEIREKRREACRIVYNMIVSIITPVISSLGIRIRQVPVYVVPEDEES